MSSDKLKGELIGIVGKDNIFTEKTERICYRFGNVTEYKLNPPLFIPDFVVQPRSTEQISQILKLANKHKVPVVAWGGGTDFTGANSPIKDGIVIDMKNFNKVKVVREENYIIAGAGTTLSKLTEEADKADLLFPHEITSQNSATIGGAIATNSFGYRSGRYRSIRNLILGIEAVLPEGDIIRTKPLFKTSLGYDFASFLVGSEGTLGIVTEVTLRLFPKPPRRKFIVYLFNSFEEGFKAGDEIWNKLSPDFFSLAELSFLKYSKSPEMFFIKNSNSKIFSKYIQSKYIEPRLIIKPLNIIFSILPQTRKLIDYVDNTVNNVECISILTVGFEDEIKVVKRKKELTNSISKSFNGLEFKDESFYANRFNNFAKLGEIVEDHFPEDRENFGLATFDLSMPKSQIIKMRKSLTKILSKYHSICLIYTELYSSIFTLGFDVIIKNNNKEEYSAFSKEVSEAALNLGGSLSFAHGVGTRFLPFLIEDLGDEYLTLMQKLKKTFDPLDILNPGKLG
ncbi:MAG: FAD-binding oxidoreductase [Candidatus Hodarchaeales archaeon]|jgi:glycolate oxidase